MYIVKRNIYRLVSPQFVVLVVKLYPLHRGCSAYLRGNLYIYSNPAVFQTFPAVYHLFFRNAVDGYFCIGNDIGGFQVKLLGCLAAYYI